MNIGRHGTICGDEEDRIQSIADNGHTTTLASRP